MSEISDAAASVDAAMAYLHDRYGLTGEAAVAYAERMGGVINGPTEDDAKALAASFSGCVLSAKEVERMGIRPSVERLKASRFATGGVIDAHT